MKPPTFIECTVCGREFGSKSIVIHERQCLQKLRRTEVNAVTVAPGKSRRKKKLTENPATAMETTPSPEPNPTQILLPKIYANNGTRNSKLPLRPTTATLSKPKFLNPEFMRHDMSLTRIDYATSQLRLGDDENLNTGTRQIFSLPAVHSAAAANTKQSSPRKESERRVVKLPDSMNSSSDSKKQSPKASIALPRKSENPSLSLLPVQKSRSFPFLPSNPPIYSRDSVMKRLKMNPFPQIRNDRSRAQPPPTSNYLLTQRRQPYWNDEEGGELLREDYSGSFSGLERGGEEEMNEEGQDLQTDVIFLRKSESFGVYSEQSYGGPDDNTFEAMVMAAIQSASRFLNASESGEFLEKFEGKQIEEAGDTLGPSTASQEIQVLPELNQWMVPDFPLHAPANSPMAVSFAALPVSIPSTTNLRSEAAGAWLFDDISFQRLTPKSILKHAPESDFSISDSNGKPHFWTQSEEWAGSGSDCDNEGTSSGYGLLRAVSSRTLLRKRRERSRMLGVAPLLLQKGEEFCTPSPVDLVPDSMSSICTQALVNELTNAVNKNNDKRQRYRFSRQAPQDKVANWLEDCAVAGLNDDPVAMWEGFDFQPNNPPPVYRRSDEEAYDTDIDHSGSGATENEEEGVLEGGIKGQEEAGKVITGLVSAVFKVKEQEETRVYKFVNKIGTGQTTSRRRIPTSTVSSPKIQMGSKAASARATQAYAPPVCYKSDKRVADIMKTLERYSLKRPQTALLKRNTHSSANGLKRPKTAEGKANSVQCKVITPLPSVKKTTIHTAQKKHPSSSPQLPTEETQASGKNNHTQKLTFGPRESLPRNREPARSTQDNGNSKRVSSFRMSSKPRPLTPRPAAQVSEISNFVPQQKLMAKKKKADKSCQAPETRSTCVQHSPPLRKKSGVCRLLSGTGEQTKKSAKSSAGKRSRKFGNKTIKENSNVDLSLTPKNQIAKIPELCGKKSAYHTHQVYQFHSAFKSKPNASGAQVIYSVDSLDPSAVAAFGVEIQEEGPGSTLYSTYTLLVPKSPVHNGVMDLNVVIRRQCAEDPLPSSSRRCSPSSMYLIIDEVKRASPAPAAGKKEKLKQSEPTFPRVYPFELTNCVIAELQNLPTEQTMCRVCNTQFKCHHQVPNAPVTPSLEVNCQVVSHRPFTADSETQTPRSLMEADLIFDEYQKYFDADSVFWEDDALVGTLEQSPDFGDLCICPACRFLRLSSIYSKPGSINKWLSLLGSANNESKEPNVIPAATAFLDFVPTVLHFSRGAKHLPNTDSESKVDEQGNRE